MTPTVRLYQGDCLDVMRTLDAGSVDAIITDLPYGTTACAWDEVIPFAPMWEQVKRVLKPRGAFVTTASQPFTSALVMSNPKWFKYCWVWNKENIGNPFMATYQPLKVHEDIAVFSRNHHVYNPQKTNLRSIRKWRQYRTSDIFSGNLTGNKGETSGLFPKTIIDISNASRSGDHPTQKPVSLYAYLIRTYTNPGDTVLDFCMGSGTTGVAAAQEDRRFIGIEKDAGYFAVAQRRIEQAQMQLPLLEAAGD